jgi:hypothetical protein
LAASNGKSGSSKQKNWGSLAGLAKLQGCSQRTMREWCKKGLIQEAEQTRGGHWRIRKPLGWKTLVFLAKRRGEWPFTAAGEKRSLFSDSEWAEILMLALVYRQGFREEPPVPYRWEETVLWDEIDEEKAEARGIQNDIEKRLQNKGSFWDLLLNGWIYQWVNHCGIEDPPCPKVTQVADWLGLKRQTLYRRIPNVKDEIAKIYARIVGKSEAELPERQAFDSVELASRRAKKPGLDSLRHDPFSDDEEDG